MKKSFIFLIVSLIYFFGQAQDVVVDIQQWNITNDLNGSFVEDTSISSSTYILGSSLSWVNYNFEGVLWEGVTTSNSEIDENGNITISFTVTSNSIVDVTEITYSVANNFDADTYRVNKYQLDYQINSDPIENLLEVVDISGTSAAAPDTKTLPFESPLTLNSGDVFHLIWSPFDADQPPIYNVIGFFIKDNSVRIKGVVRPVSGVNPVTNFTYTEGCASAGTLSWTNPASMTNRQVLVFAKKTSYIDQGTPEQDPTTYGTELSDLTTLNDGSFATIIGYDYSSAPDNDPDAMLVYRGTGTSVNLTNFENAIDYQFAAFVYDNTGTPLKYSNAQLTNGNSANTLNDIVSYTSLSKPTAADIFFVQPNCMDKIVIVANAGNAITTAPSGTNNFTANPVWAGTNDYLGGQVMYNGVGTGVNLTNLTNNQQYGISIWVEKSGNWSLGTYFSVYPSEYEAIITQEKCVDEDVVEFLTLKEINFSTAGYNMGNYSTCQDGLQFTLGDTVVGNTYFDNIILDGTSGIIPAGTFVRVFTNAGTDDLEARDGMVSLISSGLGLRDSDGDQVLLFKGATVGSTDPTDCGAVGTPNSFISAINFGNNGWLSPGSGVVSINNSYAPPSVSNLAQPAGIPDLYPNYSLKDQNSISGTVAEIHSEISQTDDSDIWFANNDASTSIVKLKDIQFTPTDFTSASATWLTSSASGELDVNLNVLTFDDETDTRYMVVVNTIFQGETPADRYTCYSNITSDYTTTDDIVTSVAGQVSSQDPCGTPTTGLGKIVYLNRDKTATVNVTGLPCGSRVFVDVYAVKGNGYTMSLGTPASGDVLLDISAPTTYYSQASGNVDGAIWDIVSSGTGAVLPEDFSSCVNLIIQAGHTVTFNQADMEVGSLTIDATGTVEVLATNILTIERDFTINGSFIANNSTVNLDGKYGGSLGFGAQIVSGSATDLTFCKLRVNNTSPTSGLGTDNDVNFNIDAKVTYGMRVDDGDFIIGGANTITLVSDVADYAAYLGALGGPDANITASITGNINAQRFFPPISTVADADAGQYGTGWRYIGAPVENADFQQIMDDFYTAGFIGASHDNFWTDANGYYNPTIKKYDETVTGTITEGFDNDPHSTLGAPEIRKRRNTAIPADITLAEGEGVLVYVSSIDPISSNSVTYDVVGQPVTGDVDVVLSYSNSGTASDDGWHLVANPYPCAIDWKLVNWTNEGGYNDGTIYIWNTEAGVSDYVELKTSATVPQYIAAHQAFWIKTNNGQITLNFKESDKIENPNGNFYKDNDEIYEEALFVNIMSEDSAIGNRAIVWFKDEATTAFDHDYDGYQLYERELNYPVLSSNIDGFDKHITTNAIPELTEDQVITFNLFVRKADTYNITFKESGYILQGSCVTMTDLVNDTTFMVDESTVYSFYSELRADTAAPMFSMTISPSVSVASTDATCFEGDNGTVTALGVGDGPFTYSWYNANNELVMEEITSETSMLDSLAQGYYSVEIDGNNTFCELTSNEVYISQPTPFVNSTVKTNPLSCTYADGFIYVTVDERAVWDITWTNIETGYSNQALAITGTYEISNLGPGTYEVVTSTDCGAPIIFEETLTDNNDIVADFTMSSDTIWLVDGGEADFLNTSENADQYYWIYDNASAMLDSSFDGSYTYTEAGIYGVTLIAQNGDACSDIITQELVVMADPNSVDDLTNEIVRSYISYNSGNAQYVIELKEAKNVQVQMLNSMGQLINTQEVNVDGKTFVDLPTYDLSSGIYIIITLDDGTRIDSKKLFVRK